MNTSIKKFEMGISKTNMEKTEYFEGYISLTQVEVAQIFRMLTEALVYQCQIVIEAHDNWTYGKAWFNDLKGLISQPQNWRLFSKKEKGGILSKSCYNACYPSGDIMVFKGLFQKPIEWIKIA